MNLIEDLSVLTTIPENTLNKLEDQLFLCIYNSIYEQKLDKKDIIEVDIGIGNLYLKQEEDNLKYKFIPNKEFNDNILKIIKTNNNPLKIKINTKLKEKICNTYKDIF